MCGNFIHLLVIYSLMTKQKKFTYFCSIHFDLFFYYLSRYVVCLNRQKTEKKKILKNLINTMCVQFKCYPSGWRVRYTGASVLWSYYRIITMKSSHYLWMSMVYQMWNEYLPLLPYTRPDLWNIIWKKSMVKLI